MRDVTRRGTRLTGLIRALAIGALVLALDGCSVVGRVYIAFFWSAADLPDAGFACDAPNVPPLASITQGRYLETVPGRYTLWYSYSTSETHSLIFELAAETTMLGQEHAYYHATLRKSSPPTVVQYP